MEHVTCSSLNHHIGDVVDDSETAVQTWTRVAKGSLGRLGIAKGDGR